MLRLQIAVRKTTDGRPGTVDIDQLSFHWDPRLHLAVLQVLDELKLFRSHVKSSSVESPPLAPLSKEAPSRKSWIVSLKGKSKVCAALSLHHSIELQAGNCRN